MAWPGDVESVSIRVTVFRCTLAASAKSLTVQFNKALAALNCALVTISHPLYGAFVTITVLIAHFKGDSHDERRHAGDR